MTHRGVELGIATTEDRAAESESVIQTESRGIESSMTRQGDRVGVGLRLGN